MVETGEIVAVRLASRSISLEGILRHLHHRGHLVPVLRQAAEQDVILHYASQVEFGVTDEDLQKATDLFRRRNGLLTAKEMHDWLSSRRLSVADFETMMLNQISRMITFDSVTQHAAQCFEETRENWDKLSLSVLVVSSESLAAELKIQCLEGDCDLDQLLKTYSNHRNSPKVTRVNDAFRSSLAKPLMAGLADARLGDLVGPITSEEGWALVLIEAVTPAVFDQETEAAIRKHLFQEWLSARIRDSRITYPLLDLLSCSNDS